MKKYIKIIGYIIITNIFLFVSVIVVNNVYAINSGLNGGSSALNDQNAQACNNNGICEYMESYTRCPGDCPPAVQDGYCNQDKAAEDPDCIKTRKEITNPLNEPQELVTSNGTQDNIAAKTGGRLKNILTFAVPLVIGTVFVIIGVIIYFKKRGGKEKTNLDNNDL